jgi:hypothetical protein
MKYFLISALFTLSLTQLKAQSSKNLKDSTVVVIFNDGSNGSHHPKAKKTDEDNIVKIAPLGFVSGMFPAFFEKKINDFFSVQLGAGLTGNDYFRNAINSGNTTLNITYPWDVNQNPDVVEPVFSRTERKSGIGYMFSIQPRVYFDDEALEGSFMAISYDYYHYTSSIPGVTSADSEGNPVYGGATKNEFENFNDLMVNFGYQTIYDHLTMEYSTGLGIRNVSGSKYAASIDYNTNTVNNEGFGTYKQTIFNFSFGLKVGYHF